MVNVIASYTWNTHNIGPMELLLVIASCFNVCVCSLVALALPGR